jgi:hypothetical protein
VISAISAIFLPVRCFRLFGVGEKKWKFIVFAEFIKILF